MKVSQRCLYICLFSLLLVPVSSFGQYWEKITNIPTGYQNTYWLDVFFLPANSNYGWICGYNGHVVRTSDGGRTWQGATVPFQRRGGTQDGHLEHVHFPTESTGYTSGPTGVFKTVDGGATWMEVTPSQAADLWGCYFLTADQGVVVGGNCGVQEFFYTDNGGATWTRFQLSMATTKLSDCILYPDGTGIAAGSGRIFRTYDFGQTWQFDENTGSNIWHEEIAALGSSILVPTAGSTCEGIGIAGGMRFFNGSEWRTFQTSSPMFGTFLTGANTGWACGYNRAMYYTADAGQTWELRNCGISGALDDIWFTSATSGWAVGGTILNSITFGDVYKYTTASRVLSKSAANFGEICFDKTDTVWIANRSFFSSVMQFTLSGDPDYQMVSPATNSMVIPPCSVVPVVVRLRAQTAGAKNGSLNFTFPQSAEMLSYKLIGKVKKQSIIPQSDVITVPRAPVGQSTDVAAYFTNLGTETATITRIDVVEVGKLEIMPQQFSNPYIIPEYSIGAPPSEVKFTITPTDTGWIESRFRIQFGEPCPKDTFITIRAYGVSPIITGAKIRAYSTACDPEKIDTIPIFNTGNDPLTISGATLSGSSNFFIIGWTGPSAQYPLSIQPGGNEGIIIRFKNTSAAYDEAILSLINNDSTRRDGRKTPYEIHLKATYMRPDISSSMAEIDLARVCLQEEERKSFYLVNKGDVPATISSLILPGQSFTVTQSNSLVPPKDSVLITVVFRPLVSGVQEGTLKIVTEPCSDTTLVAVKATAIETKIAFTPGEIFKEIRTGRKTTERITITSTGTTSAKITAIRVEPNTRGDMRLIEVPSPLPVLEPGESLQLAIEFEPATDTVFSGRIVVETAPQCLAVFEMKFFVRSTSTRLELLKTALSFTDEICVPDSSYDTLTLHNTSDLPVNITNIIVPNENYEVVSPITKTLALAGNSMDDIIIRYSFKTFSSDDVLKIITDEPRNSKEVTLNVRQQQTVRPQLSFKNKMLDLGNFRLDTRGSDTFEIINETNYTHNITGIEQTIIGNGFTITLPQLPFTLQPGAKLLIPVSFDAEKIDTVTALLKIASETACSDTNIISVSARVPAQQYPFTISIGNYYATPPDTIAAEVVLENAFDQSMVDAISLKIRMNEKLAYPLSVLSNTQQPLPYSFKNGLFEIHLDRSSFAKMPLGEAGTLFTINMLAQPSAPYVTPLDIESIQIKSRYETVPLLKDGSLHVDYCLPITGFNLGPTFSAVILTNSDNALRCEISATGEQIITFELLDIFGTSRSVTTQNFRAGSSTIEIPAAELLSGTYFLKAQSSSGAFERIKVIIVK